MLEKVTEVGAWLATNGPGIAALLLAVVAVAEAVVAFTPTKKDDGAVQRIGAGIRKLLSWLKVPNLKK